ncbi:MAG: WD40 repeat domain-containing protein [Gemmataceae bacterium]
MPKILAIVTAFLCVAPAADAQQQLTLRPHPDPLPAGAVARLGGDSLVLFSTLDARQGRVAVSADGTTVAVPGDRRSLGRRLTDGRRLPFPVGQRSVFYREMGLSADGGVLAVNDLLDIRVVDLKRGTTRSIPGAARGTAPLLTGDGRLVAGGFDGVPAGVTPRLVVWDCATGQEVAAVEPLHTAVANVVLTADGRTLASWGSTLRNFNRDIPEDRKDTIVQVWTVATGKERVRLDAGSAVGRVALTPDGTTLAAALQAGGIDLFDIVAGKKLRRIETGDQVVTSVGFSTDGSRIAGFRSNGHLSVWSAGDGAALSSTASPVSTATRPTFTGTAGVGTGLTFTGPDRGVAWGVDGRVVTVWEFPSGKVLTPPAAHSHSVLSVAFTADGKSVVSGDGGGVLAEWRLDRPTTPLVRRFGTPVAMPFLVDALDSRPIAVSGDGTMVALPTLDRNNAGVYDRLSGKLVLSATPTRPGAGRPAVFAPGRNAVYFTGRRFNLPTKDAAAAVWDVGTGAVLGKLADLYDVQAAALSPDGTRLFTVTAATSAGGKAKQYTVTRWVVETGEQAGTYTTELGYGPVSLVALDWGTVVVAADKMFSVDFVSGRIGKWIERYPTTPQFGSGNRRTTEFTAVAINRDGTRIATGVKALNPVTSAVRIYDWPDGRLLHEFTGHAGLVTTLAFSPDGKLLASGSEDTTVLVWDMTVAKKE